MVGASCHTDYDGIGFISISIEDIDVINEIKKTLKAYIKKEASKKTCNNYESVIKCSQLIIELDEAVAEYVENTKKQIAEVVSEDEEDE